MEPYLNGDFEVCAEIQKYFTSGDGTGNKTGAFENIFQMNNVSNLGSETSYKIKFI